MQKAELLKPKKRFSITGPAAMLPIIALAAVAYLPALWNGFVTDDHPLIANRIGIYESSRGLGQLVSNVYWWGTGTIDARHDLYRPLVSATLWLDYQLGGNSPFAFHFSNYLIHLANTGLVYLCFAPIAGAGTALIMAALFGVGPVAVTSVGWVAGRTDLWATLFVLLFLWFFGLSLRKRSGWYLAGAAFCFFLALASKELAIIAPFLAWALERSRSATTESHSPSRPIWHYAVLAVPLIAYVAIRWASVGVLAPRTASGTSNWSQPLPYLAEQILRSAFHAVIPLHYDYFSEFLWSEPGSRGILFALGWSVFAGFIALILYGLWKRRLWAAGGLWFGLALLPVYAMGQSWAPLSDFYIYSAIPGLLLFVVDGLRSLLQKFTPGILTNHFVVRSFAGVVIVLFALLSFVRLPILRTDSTLSTHTYERMPRSSRALISMGEECFASDRDLEAVQYMRRAAAADPKDKDPWLKCAAYYLSKSDVAHAAPFVDTLAAIAPESGDAQAMIGRFYFEAGHCQEAVQTYQKSLSLSYPTSFTLFDYGMALLCAGFDSVAVQVYQLAISQRPFWPEAYLNLGLAYEDMGKVRQALHAYQTALDQEPSNPAGWESMATLSLKTGDMARARYAAERFFQLDPSAERAERLRNAFMAAGINLNSSKNEP